MKVLGCVMSLRTELSPQVDSHVEKLLSLSLSVKPGPFLSELAAIKNLLAPVCSLQSKLTHLTEQLQHFQPDEIKLPPNKHEEISSQFQCDVSP